MVRYYYRLQDYGVSSEMGEYCAHVVCAMDAGWVMILSLHTQLLLRSETVPSFIFPGFFCLFRLFRLPNSRSMLASNIGEQHSIFALKMGRASLIYWEHAREFPCILWRRQFKTLFVLHSKKNILLVKGAKVSSASAIQSRYIFVAMDKNGRKIVWSFYFLPFLFFSFLSIALDS